MMREWSVPSSRETAGGVPVFWVDGRFASPKLAKNGLISADGPEPLGLAPQNA
jgi:hypothetical protein